MLGAYGFWARRGFARFYSGGSRIIRIGAWYRHGILLDVWRVLILPLHMPYSWAFKKHTFNIVCWLWLSLCVLCCKIFQKTNLSNKIKRGWVLVRPVCWSWIRLHFYINTGYIFVLIYWWLIYWRHDRKGDMKYMYSNVILFVIHYPQGRVIGRSSYARGATVLWFMVRKNSTFCWIRNLFHLWDKILSF